MEEDSFSCKVTHDLTHPNMCIVMDEVEVNISQKRDGHIRDKLLIKVNDSTEKVNTKDKHWTLLGLAALNRYPLMCIIIFAGIKSQAVWKQEWTYSQNKKEKLAMMIILKIIVGKISNIQEELPIPFREQRLLV